MFNMLGMLEQGTTLVGNIEKENQTYLVYVALAENMSKGQRKKLEMSIRDTAGKPEALISHDEDKKLYSAFFNASQPVLTVALEDPSHCVATIEPVLATNYRKIIFICNDKKTYLTACSELSVPKRDFFRFAQLKTVLNETKERNDSVVGYAHKLVESLTSGKIVSPFSSMMSREGLKNTAEAVIDAEKFWVPDDKWDPVNDDFLFYPGDYRLPFAKCLFEFPWEGRNPMTQQPIKMRTFALAQDNGSCYYAFLYDYVEHTKSFIQWGFGPSWTVKENGDIDRQEVVALHPDVVKFYEQDADPDGMYRRAYSALRRFAPALTAMNEPRANIVSYDPPGKIARRNARSGRLPFFKYNEVSIEDIIDAKGQPMRGSAVRGREGVALHKVRGHIKPSIDKWVPSYPRGDARYGVILKSFTMDNDS